VCFPFPCQFRVCGSDMSLEVLNPCLERVVLGFQSFYFQLLPFYLPGIEKACGGIKNGSSGFHQGCPGVGSGSLQLLNLDIRPNLLQLSFCLFKFLTDFAYLFHSLLFGLLQFPALILKLGCLFGFCLVLVLDCGKVLPVG